MWRVAVPPVFDPAHRVSQSPDDFNEATIDALTKAHAPYFSVMDAYVTALNARVGRPVVFIVPDAQATLALRAQIIAGTAPGLLRQSDLFVDAWGHPALPLRVLSAYCHFAVIYRRSPVGLPLPPSLTEQEVNTALHRLLQELAWEAVRRHPLSGVHGASGPC